MRALLFLGSAGLAITGMGLSILATQTDGVRLFFIGMVLLAGAAVFAILYLGTRRDPDTD